MKHILLIEIGTEELPAKMLRRFGELFASNIAYEFKIVNFIYERIIWLASARRLAVQVINIVFNADIDKSYVAAGLSLIQFNKKDYRDKYFLYSENNKLLLSNVISDNLVKLPVAMMRWKGCVRFVRPVRTVSVLLDDQVILCNLLGLSSDRVIRGHRFMGKKEIILDHAKNYQEVLLNEGFVVVDYKQRKDIIRCGVESIAKNLGGVVDYTGNLLEELTALSEWPVVLFGSFDKSFLNIPMEILLYIMKMKKKYFPLYGLEGKLLPYFIFVIDIVTDSHEKIITYHEKILNLSFSDAQFFLNCDSKYRLDEYLSRLQTVLFHKKLGNLYDKSIRIKCLSSWVASQIGINISQVERAAILSKCDLLSNMVCEFPFSQGIMGMHYALRDGESKVVALAQKEQYQPRFSSDLLPSESISCVISIVDKVDTISGMFIIGEHPKGSRDPMGLRRAAIGVLRIITEKRISVDLWSLVESSLKLYNHFSVDELVRKIIDFMYKRLCVLYERKGYRRDIIWATLNDKLSNLENFDNRISAVSVFCLSEEARLLFFIYKRVFNILQQGAFGMFNIEINNILLVKEEEVILSEKVLIFRRELQLMCKEVRYCDALYLLVGLYNPLDQFFKNVIVMVEDENIRLNRLALLSQVWGLLLEIMNTPQYIFNLFSRNQTSVK